MPNSHLSYIPSKFVQQIKVLDDLQLSMGEPPDTKKWENWLWTQAESQYITSVRTRSEGFMNIINSQRYCPPETKDKMTLLIDEYMDYDHGPHNAHHLLDKIALNGSIDDCEKLGIKRSTQLAKEPGPTGSNVVVNKVTPVLTERVNKIGRHLLGVRNPATPNSGALPQGVSRARVFRFIGTTSPTSISRYESIGNAKRGIIEINYENMAPTEDRLFAWYIARYEDTKGELWDACDPLKLEIYFPAI
jgi:hypothetical protein